MKTPVAVSASVSDYEGWVPHSSPVFGLEWDNTALIAPFFVIRSEAEGPAVRLSLMKSAHADLSSAAWQEIGVKPCFWA